MSVVSPNLTTKWFDDSDYVQVVELFVENTDKAKFLTKRHCLQVTIDSPSLDTVIPGTVHRLASGQRALVHVGVKNKAGVPAGAPCDGQATATASSHGKHMMASAPLSGVCGLADFENTAESLLAHRTPDWFDKIKYGIFIHWGLYSVPAYGNTGENESYAEWYWRLQNAPTHKSETYQYHLKTYGENVNYDDFMANFTGKDFDAKEWVDLFVDAGAQYFVPTTKHQDGFALFNFSSTISRRSSVHYSPQRDFIGELFAAARQHQPHLRRGTYFSLPEFYNPEYKYGSYFPGGPPRNPYTNATLDYTGHVAVDDFVADVQAPQIEVLAYDYDAEIMWCDMGGPNQSADFMANWINWARQKGRQVSFNSRCGLQGDYDTPEYEPNPTRPLDRKWESSRGMDPHSYGYNHLTPDDEYMTGEEIVTTLVDIVANNGNFLLDIGPDGHGAVPDIMQTNLRDAGAWIRAHGEAIFNTTYWPVTAGADPWRYTATADAFYIHHVGKPAETALTIPDPVPFLPGDCVTAVGGAAHGTEVESTWKGPGTLKLELPQSVVDGDKYIWTFKIEYVR